MSPHEALQNLHALYPDNATRLAEFIRKSNADQKLLPQWREEQLIQFIGLMRQNVEDLEQAYKERRITKLAWAARNLLEIIVWIEYCNASDEKAKRFSDDAARDLRGYGRALQIHAPKASAEATKGLSNALNELDAAAGKLGIVGFDQDFKEVRKAAEVVGRKTDLRAQFQVVVEIRPSDGNRDAFRTAGGHRGGGELSPGLSRPGRHVRARWAHNDPRRGIIEI